MFRNYPCHKHTITPPQPTYLSTLISKVSQASSWLGITSAAPTVPTAPPAPAPAPLPTTQVTGLRAPPSSTVVMIGAMAPALPPGSEHHPWYYLHPKESLFIGYDAISNFVWSIMSQLQLDAKFAKTDNFFQQAGAQQLYSLLAVIIASPLGVFLTNKFYEEPINIAIPFSIICGVSAVCSVIPWDYFVSFGQQFFQLLGYNEATANYLAVLFPGPGTIAGPLQTLMMTFLSKALDPNFIFTKSEFFAGISPITFLSPNVWKAVFDGMANVAEGSTWGLIGQASLVMLACGITDFFTIKAVTAIANYFNKPATTTTNANTNATAPTVVTAHNAHIPTNMLAATGSHPVHTQAIYHPPAPPSQAPGTSRNFSRP